MATYFALPVFTPDQYQAFRREVGENLADTYDDWAKLMQEQVDEARRQGHTIVDVPVDFHEFQRHLRATGQKADARILLNFALKKIPREK